MRLETKASLICTGKVKWMKSVSVSVGSVVIHLYLFLDLFQQPLSCVLAQIEIIAEFLNYLIRVVILKDFYLFNVFSVELDLEDADRLLDHRKERRQWAVHPHACWPWWRRKRRR